MGFSPDWLDLREPADHAARDAGLLAQAAGCVRDGQIILDLGSGTGSTARALDGFAWRFLDADAGLLALAAARHPASEQLVFDLRHIDMLPLDGVGLVTASALLDLMPATWIETLAQRLATAGVPFYAALSYNGQMEWTPALPQDAAITAAFNRHQLRDKGLGPAAGPYAATVAIKALLQNGFTVQSAQSPWALGPEHAALHGELLTGIAAAAAEMGQPEAGTWLRDRQSMLAQTRGLIGHTDILALPPAPANQEFAAGRE